ncbi:VanZ family protein [bacterium]
MNRSWPWVYGPTLAYMILIIILSSIPSMRPPDLGLSIEDKIAHLLEYGVLGALLARSVLLRKPFSIRLFIWIFLFGSLFGVSDEIYQKFVPNRNASPWDALADTIGVFFGLLIYWNWKSRHVDAE